MSVTANYSWPKSANREQELEILLQQILDGIDADLKAAADTPYAARVYNSANISVANNTLTFLTFNSERRDDGGLHSTSANTDRLTAPVAGWYSAWGNVEFAANAAGSRSLSIRKNVSNTVLAAHNTAPVSGVDVTGLAVKTLCYLTAGEYVRLAAVQTSGGALNVNWSAEYSPEFALVKVA